VIDLLIKNAVYLDPETGKEQHTAVGIQNGEIVFLGPGTDLLPEAAACLDASGTWLVPNLMDFHTHVFTKGSGFGVNADLLLSSGATMVVDMGTAGSANYEAFHQTDVIPRTIPVKSFINLSPLGQPGAGLSEPLAPEAIHEERIAALAEQYRGEILGIKVRISKNIVGDLGLSPLAHAVELGEKLGMPVCVHTTNPPEEAEEIVKLLRPGDIYSHVYHGKGKTILKDGGRIPEEFYRARERGVLMEVGNGRMNFNFQVAEKAFENGFYPDIISSDATARTLYHAPDMKDLPFVMSKFWNMGMPLHKVFEAVTSTPATCLGLGKENGRLKKGMKANLTIFRRIDGSVEFTDSDGNMRTGYRRLSPEMTMVNGRILYLQGSCRLKKQ